MRMDGAASLTPGTPWLPKGMPVPGCVLQAVLVLHLVQLGLRGLQRPANIAQTGSLWLHCADCAGAAPYPAGSGMPAESN